MSYPTKEIPWDVSGSVQTTTIGNEIFVCGGFSGSRALQTCGVYTPATDSWSGMPDLPHGVHHAAAGTGGLPLTDKNVTWIYSTPLLTPFHTCYPPSLLSHQDPYPAHYVAGLRSYSMLSIQITQVAAFDLRCITDGKRFYIFGGRQGGNSMNPGQPHTQVYDPKTRAWLRGKDMITPRSGTGKAVFLVGEFYVMVCGVTP